jgi:putative Holliday junction resolvase
MKYLAIDYGDKRLGLAISDPDARLAFAHAAHERAGHNRDAAAIIALVRGLGIEAIVFGQPLGLAANTRATTPGSDSPGTETAKYSETANASDNDEMSAGERKARAFAAVLGAALAQAGLPIEVLWWDERFSTRQAHRGMLAAGISQRRGRHSSGTSSVDARSAAVILQAFLDHRNAAGDTSEPGD